jgi:hypothetical protein
MDYRNNCVITRQSVYKGNYMTDVVIRGVNLLSNGKNVKKVTLAGIPGNVIMANKYDIFLYAGRGESGRQGDICIENEHGEIVRGGSWKYE